MRQLLGSIRRWGVAVLEFFGLPLAGAAKEDPGESVTERIDRVRAGIKAQQHAAESAPDDRSSPTDAEQWNNWNDWKDWSDWQDWAKWANVR